MGENWANNTTYCSFKWNGIRVKIFCINNDKKETGTHTEDWNCYLSAVP